MTQWYFNEQNSITILLSHILAKTLIRKKMSVLFMILSVVLVVATLTGSTNNYYNGKILTTITNG